MKIFHPAFLVFMIVLLIFGYGFLAVVYLMALVFHELGHALVAKKFGYKLKSFYLMPYGACLSYEEHVFLENEEFLIAIAGPLMNLFLCLICIALWWIFPVMYALTLDFASANFFLALLNFLPAFPLDGGRILLANLSNKMDRKKAIKISLIFNYVFCFIFIFVFIISCFNKINFSFLIMAIFLFLSVFDGKFQGKYQRIFSQDKSKILKKGIKLKTMAFSSKVPLYKISREISSTKYNVFFIVSESGKAKLMSENSLKSIIERNNANDSFSDIFPNFE